MNYKTKFIHIKEITSEYKEYWIMMKAILSSYIVDDWNEYYQYGFEVLGPFLFGFSKWLHTCAEGKVNHLFFLSRDGYLLQKVYMELYGDDAISNSYLYVSRKAMRLPQIWIDPSMESILKTFAQFDYLRCQDICFSLGIDLEEGLKVWKSVGLKENDYFLPVELQDNSQFKKFYSIVEAKIIENSKKEFKKLEKYLLQEKFIGNVGIVDVGWAGTIQTCLKKIASMLIEDISIAGFYLGVDKRFVSEDKYSYVDPKNDIQQFVAALIEYPLLSHQGSLLGYKEDNVEPVFSEYEFKSLDEEKIVQQMQDGAIYFIKIFKELYKNYPLYAENSYENLRVLTKKPTLKEVELFGNCMYFDGDKRYLAKPNVFIEYCIHPKKLKYDLSVAGWKIGFLKRLLKIKLNYDALLSYVKEKM